MPKTEQGKARSADNATKHGLTSQKMYVLQNENAEALWDKEMDQQAESFAANYESADEGMRQALAFQTLAENKTLSLLSRYETRLKRDYRNAIKALEEWRAKRTPESEPARQHSRKPATTVIRTAFRRRMIHQIPRTKPQDKANTSPRQPPKSSISPPQEEKLTEDPYNNRPR